MLGFNSSHFYSIGGTKSNDNRYSSGDSVMVKPNTDREDHKTTEDKVGDGLKSIRNSKDFKVLYVEQLPPHLAATPDAVKILLENMFGKVDKMKMIRSQPTTALVQMESLDGAKNAVLGQDKFREKIQAPNIVIKFCTTIKEVRLGRGEEFRNNNEYTRKGGMPNSMMYPGQYRMRRNNNTFQGFPSFNGFSMMDGYATQDQMMMSNLYGGQQQGLGCCLFVSRLPEDIANPDCICNLLGVYGDVYKVQMIKNNSALVEMATPQQASNAKGYLDQAKIGENKMIVNYSNKPGIKKMNENKDTFKDYTRAGIHRFQGLKPGHKMLRNFHRPSAELFVSRFESGKSDKVKEYFEKSGYTVKEVKEIGQKGDMAILTLGSVEESIKALAKFHNTMPEELGEKRGRRGLTLNFAMSSNRKGGKFNKNLEGKTSSDTNDDSKSDANEEQNSKIEETEQM